MQRKRTHEKALNFEFQKCDIIDQKYDQKLLKNAFVTRIFNGYLLTFLPRFYHPSSGERKIPILFRELSKSIAVRFSSVFKRLTSFDGKSSVLRKDEHLTKGSPSLSNRFLKVRPTLSSYYLLFLLFGLQNAFPCLGFGNTQHSDYPGVFGYSYPYWSPSMNAALYQRNYMRQLNDDPLLIMPTSTGSLTNDRNGLPPTSMSPNITPWASMLTTGTDDPQTVLDNHVRQILIPRVSGTAGNIQVRKYIVDNLRANDYHIELDEFTDSTPNGKVNFANIIATSNPDACRQLVLACHYDSKLQDGFLGATDSAVPCAMLLKISEKFRNLFRQNDKPSTDLGLMFIFFDGEEAFEKWSSTDSLYGSRHLAAKWEKEPQSTECRGRNQLSKIELFVLLDLIGTSDTTFVMYNRRLRHHYVSLQNHEKTYLLRSGLRASQADEAAAFRNRFIPLDFVEDDHVPFKRRGVPILSLLAHPFPSVWHTNDDNYAAIDYPRTLRILHVLEEFVANYSKTP